MVQKKSIQLNTYVWQGTNQQGMKAHGEAIALNIETAKAELQTTGITVVKIKLKPKDLLSFIKKKIKFKDIVFFSRHLATMIGAKMPLIQALEVIAKGTENINVRSLIVEVKTDVENGNTFTSALSKYPEQFDNLFCGLVHAGEQSGTLETMLNKIANHLEKTQSLRNKMKKACVYPAAIVSTALIVSACMLLFVVPQFEVLFNSQGAQLPAFTKVIIGLSKFVQAYWYIILILLIVGICYFNYARKHIVKFSHFVDLLTLKLPIFGKLVEQVIFARFSRTLGITLAAGIPLVDALTLVTNVIKNSIYANALNQIKTTIATGQQMNVAMSLTHLFPSLVTQMIQVGEKTGSTKDILNKIADYYEEEVDGMVTNMSSLMEPLIIVLLGGMVGTLVVAMYLPIFKLGSVF